MIPKFQVEYGCVGYGITGFWRKCKSLLEMEIEILWSMALLVEYTPWYTPLIF